MDAQNRNHQMAMGGFNQYNFDNMPENIELQMPGCQAFDIIRIFDK